MKFTRQKSAIDVVKDQAAISTACLVIPTYNEAANIKGLLDQIFEVERAQPDKKNPVALSVLVVDDSSPDGTAEIVRTYQKHNRKVHLLLRKEKNGLGAAYIAGIQHAMKRFKPDVIFEMDADGQHNPQDIYRLIGAIKEGADFVIGSRYVKGGSIPKSWGLGRRIKSKCANFVVRTMLGTTGVKDCSGGYRAIRRSLLKKIDFDSLRVKGYAFQAVMLEEAVYHGAVVREVPIAFADREKGVSKMGLRELVEGFSVFAAVRRKRVFANAWAAVSSQRSSKKRIVDT